MAMLYFRDTVVVPSRGLGEKPGDTVAEQSTITLDVTVPKSDPVSWVILLFTILVHLVRFSCVSASFAFSGFRSFFLAYPFCLFLEDVIFGYVHISIRSPFHTSAKAYDTTPIIIIWLLNNDKIWYSLNTLTTVVPSGEAHSIGIGARRSDVSGVCKIASWTRGCCELGALNTQRHTNMA